MVNFTFEKLISFAAQAMKRTTSAKGAGIEVRKIKGCRLLWEFFRGFAV